MHNATYFLNDAGKFVYCSTGPERAKSCPLVHWENVPLAYLTLNLGQ